MSIIGSLGQVAYDLIAQDKTGEGLDSARQHFVVTAGDIVNAIKSVTTELAAFDEKNAKLNTDLGITALTLGMNAEDLRGWAKELSSATDPIDEMAGAIDALARAGVRNHDAMIESVNGFDRIADAIGKPTDELTNQLIPAFKAFGVSVEDVNGYADVLSYTFNTTQVSADEFSAVVKRMGPELNEVGVSIDDLATFMVILKDRGVESKNLMKEFSEAMSKASDTNKDGKISFDELLASMQITNDEFSTTQKRLEVSSQGYADLAGQIRNKNTPIQDQYNTSIDNTVLGLGGLTSPLTSAASLFGSFAGTISSIAIPAMILFPAKFAAIGPAITNALSGLSGSVGTAAAGLGGSIAAGVAGGILLGLAGVWVLLKTGVLDALAGLGDAISESDIGEPIMDALKIALAPIGSIGAAIIDIVKGDFASIPEHMAEPFNQAGDAIGRYIDRIRSVVSDGISAIASGFGGLGASLAGASGQMAAFATSAFSGISGAFQGMSGQIQGVFSQMMSAIQTAITSTAGGFFNAGQNIITSMANGIIAAFNAVKGLITDFFNWIANLIPHSPAKEGPLSQPPNWGSYLTQGMSGAEGQVKSGATSMVQAAADGISGTMAKPAIPGSAATGSGGGDTITIAAGAIVINGAGQNAKEIADMVISEFSRVRKQRGIRS